MKRIFAFLLVFSLVLGNTVTAFAQDETNKSTATGAKNSTTEITDDHDQSKWNVGTSIELDTYYQEGASRDDVLADIQELATSYGLTVTQSGFIGNGSSNSAGNVCISGDNNGNWDLIIYAWRSSPEETGLNKTMNVTLQVMKYFLGDENGETLWSFWDAVMTGQNPNPSNFGMNDDGGSGKTGSFTFPDGLTVDYDQTSNHQTVFTLA